MDTGECLRVGEGHMCLDTGIDVAGQDPVAVVAKLIGHQRVERLAHPGHSHWTAGRATRQTVAGEGCHHHVETVRGITTGGRRIGQQRDECEHLHERAGSSVKEVQRSPVRPSPALVDKMKIDAVGCPLQFHSNWNRHVGRGWGQSDMERAASRQVETGRRVESGFHHQLFGHDCCADGYHRSSQPSPQDQIGS